MSKNASRRKIAPVSVKENILRNKEAFTGYNIARLRELIRYFPKEKLDLFYSMPLFLHVNSPNLPGYVKHPRAPHGIYRFFDSGFWRRARNRLGIDGQTISAFVLRRSYVRGLYLVGSPGTLDQKEQPELNYWVVIDQSLFSGTQQGLLREKLVQIRDWAKETCDHHVTFSVLNVEQFRGNDFSAMDDTGGGALQQELLKEEFYRTFILIAGQMPYWAVFPCGLNDSEYSCWTETASLLSGADFVADDYVDLGNLISVKSKACLGGLIWEIARAPEDPVEALIRASVVAYHHFFQERKELLCNVMKKSYPEARLDKHFLDPYVLAFRSIVKFYEFIDDEEGMDLIRECIYLRLTGYPLPSLPDHETPKGQLLRRYARAWSWADHQIHRLDAYRLWTEDEKLQFEERITRKLFFLYELVFRSSERLAPSNSADSEAVVALRKRRESYFTTKPGKIPYCSASRRAEGPTPTLRVAWQQDRSGAKQWTVYHGLSGNPQKKEVPLFVAPELLRVLGWVVLNRLCSRRSHLVLLRDHGSPMLKQGAQSLLEALLTFFPNQATPFLHARDASPRWWKVFVALDTGVDPAKHVAPSVDCLLQNTWGEMFFDSLDLRDIENDLLRCYDIAKRVWHYVGGAGIGETEYWIYEYPTIRAGKTMSAIEDFLESFRDAEGKNTESRVMNRPRGHTRKGKQRGPLIDLL